MVPAQRLGIGPEQILGRSHDTPSFKARQVSGKIVREAKLSRGDDFVLFRDSEQSLVEGPVAHPAQRHAVGWSVVIRLTPRDDMRRRDRRVTIDGADADATQGATMEVRGNDGPPETLVASRRPIRFFVRQRLFDSGIFGTFQQLLTVDKSATIDALCSKTIRLVSGEKYVSIRTLCNKPRFSLDQMRS